MKLFVTIALVLFGVLDSGIATDDIDNLPSIAYSVFLDRNVDPYYDSYTDRVLHMPMSEVLHLPQVDDPAFFFDMARGIEALPQARTTVNLPFNEVLDDEIISQSGMDGEFILLMVSGPATINFISSVMTLSSKKDYPFASSGKFNYIKYPGSFRATLVQTSNEMYRALMAAHTGMNRIQLNMKQLPSYIKTALKLILQGTPKLIKALLPLQLDNIERITHECAVIANTTHGQFFDLIELLMEIEKLNTLTLSENEKENLRLRNETNTVRESQMALEQHIKYTTEQYAKITKELEEKQKAYQEAVQAIPASANALGQQAYYSYSRWFGWRRTVYYRPHPDQSKYTQSVIDSANQRLSELKDAQKEYQNLVQKQQIQQSELIDKVHSIALTNLTMMNLDQYIDIIRKAAAEIGEISKQWGRLVDFFSTLAARADSTKKTVATKFLKVIELLDVVNGAEDLNSLEKEFYIMLLVEAAKEIDGDAHLLFLASKTYYDVSREYMVHQIAGVSGLLGISTDAERTAHMQKMSSETVATTTKMKLLMKSRLAAYDIVNTKRQEEFNTYLMSNMLEEITGLIG